jgi:FkbM family methyltransferase
MQFGKSTLKPCKYGWMLFNGPYIGKCFDLYGEYSESEVSLMRAYLRRGDIAIDVGANIGDLTIPLARIVAESGKVYAIESNPDNFNILCANLALNGIRHVRPTNAFVATSDQVPTSGPWGKYAYTSEIWETRFLSLDSLNLPSCHLIKIDVDGNELEVLKSGEALIRDHRPVLYFENDIREASAPLLAYVLELGYDLFWHRAPIFSQNNFFGNPVNHWSPQIICSLMILGVPREKTLQIPKLEKVESPNDWWKGIK